MSDKLCILQQRSYVRDREINRFDITRVSTGLAIESFILDKDYTCILDEFSITVRSHFSSAVSNLIVHTGTTSK
jgi:hypothetical protein